MAIATKRKPTTLHHKKRTAAHHRQTKHYVKSYWPYLPMLAVVLSGFIVSNLLQRPAVLGANTSLGPQQLLVLTNDERTAAHDATISLDSQLNQAAQNKANDMAKRNYWSHLTPEGKQPWSFVTSVGYQYIAAGENLAYGFDSADAVTNAWMHSTEHRENLLNNDFTQVGFGVAQAQNYLGSGQQTIVVAMYARPSTAVPVTTPAAPTELSSSISVSRVDTFASAAGGFFVGIIGAIAVMLVLLRHGIAWRRLVSRGELFVVQHPMLDIALVGVATFAVILSQTVGFIH